MEPIKMRSFEHLPIFKPFCKGSVFRVACFAEVISLVLGFQCFGSGAEVRCGSRRFG